MPQIGIAISDEERLKRLRGAPLSPMPAPRAPQVERKKGAGEQMMDIATERATQKGADIIGEEVLSPLADKGMEIASAGADKIAGAFKLAPTKAAAQKAALSMGPGGVGGVSNVATSGLAKTAAAVTPGTTGTGMSSLANLFGMGGSGAAAAGTGAAGTGTMAAMMASPLAPIALGLLAGKAFKLFSEGGHVGPLYSAEGSKVSTTQAILDNLTKQKKKKESYENKSVLDTLAGSNLVDYKANGGITGFRSANPNAQPMQYATGFRKMPAPLSTITPGRQQTKNFAIAIPAYTPYSAPVASSGNTGGGDGGDSISGPGTVISDITRVPGKTNTWSNDSPGGYASDNKTSSGATALSGTTGEVDEGDFEINSTNDAGDDNGGK